MKTFKVTLFILGLPYDENNTRVEYIDAETQDEAEQLAHEWYIADGWGVYSSVEVRDGLSETQKKRALDYASELLSKFIPNDVVCGEVMDRISQDILDNIADCAGWQELKEDEWDKMDVELALGDVFEDRIGS